jgi:DNA-binding XRE family transcriptional regulator
MKKEIGIRLKECRKNVNMTQREVAKILSMTQQQYSRFENGIYELNNGINITSIGFVPKYTFEEGITKTKRWCECNCRPD